MKSLVKNTVLMSTLFLLALVAVVPASATILIPPIPTPGLPPDAIFPSGFIIADTGLQPFVSTLGAEDFSGEYRQVVVQDTSGTNPFCFGCLDFIFYFTSDAGSGLPIERVTASSFFGFSTDVGWYPGLGGIGAGTIIPTTIDRPSGFVVGFNFSGGVAGGEGTRDLVIDTNATLFKPGHLSFINSGTATVDAFAPAAIPEPASLALLGTGLVGLAGLMRRKRSS